MRLMTLGVGDGYSGGYQGARAPGSRSRRDKWNSLHFGGGPGPRTQPRSNLAPGKRPRCERHNGRSGTGYGPRRLAFWALISGTRCVLGAGPRHERNRWPISHRENVSTGGVGVEPSPQLAADDTDGDVGGVGGGATQGARHGGRPRAASGAWRATRSPPLLSPHQPARSAPGRGRPRLTTCPSPS